MKKIKFQPEPVNGFYNTLKQRVYAHFRDNKISRYANTQAIVKALVFFCLYISSYVIILSGKLPLGVFWPAWFFMGAAIMFAAMSIVHDAAHGSFSSRKWVNQLLLRFANLVGGDGYIYKYKHTISHHPYTNIPGIDIDLEQSNIVRVTPYTKSRTQHRHQSWYMKILYPFYIFYWVLLRDFRYYRLEKIGPVRAHHATIHWMILFISKLFYIFYMLVVPFLVLSNPFWQILLGFTLTQIGSGVVAMFALLSNHVVEDSLFVLPDENGMINCSWGEHQLRTTDDFSPNSSVVSFFFSGLNHHVAHHLFPRYCHIHYPAITKLVRSTASEFGLRYRYNSLTRGLSSHFRLLKKLSQEQKKLNHSYNR